MRQKIYYDSDDYTGSVIFWIILICIAFCFIFWWPTPAPDTTNAAYTATQTGAGWGWTWFWISIGVLFFWWLITLCFAPLDVSADDYEVRIRRPLKTRRIKISDIESAEPYQVSPTAKKKAFGTPPVKSFGKWGKYHDEKIGDYFAYYGKPDNTVLITLKNGQKYVVGGTDSKELSDYINSKIK